MADSGTYSYETIPVGYTIPGYDRDTSTTFQSADWIWDQTPSFTATAGPIRFKVRKVKVSDWSIDGTDLDLPTLPFRKSSIDTWAAGMDIAPEKLDTLLASHGWWMPDKRGAVRPELRT